MFALVKAIGGRRWTRCFAPASASAAFVAAIKSTPGGKASFVSYESIPKGILRF